MKVAIITLNYNGAKNTIRLLESLRPQMDEDVSIIVADNASSDVGELRNYPGIHLIENNANLGFAGGNEPALKYAFQEGSDWAVLLNNDTWVGNGFIERLKAVLEAKEGLVGLPVEEDGQTVYGGKIEWLKAPSQMHHLFEVPDPSDDFYIIGAALAISRKAYEKLGPIDDRYFLYFEDTDYSVNARRRDISMSYVRDPVVHHGVSQSAKKLGSPLLLRLHYRNAMYFNWKNGPLLVKILLWPWAALILLKQIAKIVLGINPAESVGIIQGINDFCLDRMGKIKNRSTKRIGIECESIEGKNPTWGVGRIIMKLLEDISKRPELKEEFEFVLYFKDKVPDLEVLKAPIFKKVVTPVPGFPNRLWPIYYYALLPLKLWFQDLDAMFWPNYMLPIIAPTPAYVMLTEDVYYEAHEGKMPFRYRLAYGIFGWWTAKFANKIMAISETSKHNISHLYDISEKRIVVNHLGINLKRTDTSKRDPQQAGLVSEGPAEGEDEAKAAAGVSEWLPGGASARQGTLSAERAREEVSASEYFLYVGQAFPRRHLKETIKAFEKVASEHPELKIISVGPDKYEKPVIKNLVSEINKRLGREVIIHKDYVSDEELEALYKKAKALIYVSDREAFGLPPMEALSFGVPPIVMDNALGHELFGEYAFYSKDGTVENIQEAIIEVLSQEDKADKIKFHGPEHVAKYSWEAFANRWLETVRNITS